MSELYLPFTLSEQRYDLGTYWGRFLQINEVSSCMYAFKTNREVIHLREMIKSQLQKEKQALEKTGSPKVLLSESEIYTLRNALNVTKGAIHPDTNEPIPMPMRVTFFIPANIPISLGMIFSAPTMFNTLFF